MEIHLGIAFDQNYLTPFYALASSIFYNNKSQTTCIHAIVNGISEQQIKEIQEYVHLNKGKINFYTIDEASVNQFVLTSKWTSAVYYRLYFPLLVPSTVERLVYLDTDTLVLNDLSTLFEQSLDAYPVGAVYDNWVKVAPQLGIIDEGKYFNSGVLLIDIKKWNEQKVSERTFQYLNEYPEKINFVDQDALNAVLKDNWKKLDSKFNFMYSLIPEGISKNETDILIADKVIIHFTLTRPWQLLCKNRYRYLYHQYLKHSPLNTQGPIIDFEWSKLLALLKLRCIELYYDMPGLQKVWKKVKQVRFTGIK